MTSTEYKVIKKIRHTLQTSSLAGWSSGDIDKWSDWAKSMRDVIRASVSTLDGLIEDYEETKEQNGNVDELL